MSENYEQIWISAETFEPFVLCLALGTLAAMKAKVWSSEAGIWTVGRPAFLNKLEELNISDATIDVLVQFDELNALEKFGGKENFENELLKVEQAIKKRLENFSEDFWRVKWANEDS